MDRKGNKSPKQGAKLRIVSTCDSNDEKPWREWWTRWPYPIVNSMYICARTCAGIPKTAQETRLWYSLHHFVKGFFGNPQQEPSRLLPLGCPSSFPCRQLLRLHPFSKGKYMYTYKLHSSTIMFWARWRKISTKSGDILPWESAQALWRLRQPNQIPVAPASSKS